MININEALLEPLTIKARMSHRDRMTYNFHLEASDTLQRMLNAMEPGTYIRPHKHEDPDKREAFFALRGTLCLIEFYDSGEVKDYTILNAGERNYGAEIAEKTWHSIISLESGSVAYEVKDGPYDPMNDKNFAPWAPEENSPGAMDYLKNLIQTLGLKVA